MAYRSSRRRSGGARRSSRRSYAGGSNRGRARSTGYRARRGARSGGRTQQIILRVETGAPSLVQRPDLLAAQLGKKPAEAPKRSMF